MKKATVLMASMLLFCTSAPGQQKRAGERADELLARMTLEEKIGQLNQLTDNKQFTGPARAESDRALIEQIEQGSVGSMLNVKGADRTRMFQQAAMKTRLGIPLLFGLDVIHGMQTVFPLPIAEASSFDPDAIRRSARWAATEMAACGLHWTFAPMVDVSVDPRWGRSFEGAGEDPFLGSIVARARVEGFQGEELSDPATVLACCKHYAAYGAPRAGKDYNSVDMSMGHFYNFYMPPYKAACEAGATTFMTSFSDFNNVPCTGSSFLLRDLLKGEWGFEGFVVTDWGSIQQMIPHGCAEALSDAARIALEAGVDMDMMSRAYIRHLPELLEQGKVRIEDIDEAVRRILTMKFRLGLFDDPFRYCDAEREKKTVLSPAIREAARDMGRRSVILLKNENRTLPLARTVRKIALIGALCDSRKDMLGFWAHDGIPEAAVTLRAALTDRGYDVEYEPAYALETLRVDDPVPALAAAAGSDLVIVAVGERWDDSGEGRSRGNLDIEASQQQLVEQLCATGKPVVVLVMGGRPLIFNQIGETAPAILFTWWLGTEAGNALCDVLFGDYNPAARLPMTFPGHIAQIPIYHYTKNTGKPYNPNQWFTTQYIDIDQDPAYPFGYGLSYTSFAYSDFKLDRTEAGPADRVTAEVTVTNTGAYDGEEVVQLYVRDRVASVTRPVKELRGFRKIFLRRGESEKVVFEITDRQLGFYNNDLEWVVEPGEFVIMTGPDSENLSAATLKIVK